MPRRGNRTQPGVLAPGMGHKHARPAVAAEKRVKTHRNILWIALDTSVTDTRVLPPLQGGAVWGAIPGVETPGLVL